MFFHLSILLFLWPHCAACGILVPQPGTELVLTTGSPGKSHHLFILKVIPGLPRLLGDKESAYNAGDVGSIPGLGRFPGEENGKPLQYSWRESPMDRRAWRAIVR